MKTQIQIIEDNKLIAEFYGCGMLVNDIYVVFIPQASAETKFVPARELQFDTSWNWLMPVVEKIETMGYDVNIKGISCSVNRILEKDAIIHCVCGDKSKKLELVHCVVVDFIKWHNAGQSNN